MTPDAQLAVLISGNGSNLQAIIDATRAGSLDAQVAVVVSNRADAFGLRRAEQAGIPTITFPIKPYRVAGRPRAHYDADLASLVMSFQPRLVILAGWMLVLSPAFLDRFPQRVLNLHPALPGQFPGTHAIERAFAAFQSGEIDHTGVMVHIAVPEVDAGPVIASAEVPITAADTLPELEARIHATEHRLLVAATQAMLAQEPSRADQAPQGIPPG